MQNLEGHQHSPLDKALKAFFIKRGDKVPLSLQIPKKVTVHLPTVMRQHCAMGPEWQNCLSIGLQLENPQSVFRLDACSTFNVQCYPPWYQFDVMTGFTCQRNR